MHVDVDDRELAEARVRLIVEMMLEVDRTDSCPMVRDPASIAIADAARPSPRTPMLLEAFLVAVARPGAIVRPAIMVEGNRAVAEKHLREVGERSEGRIVVLIVISPAETLPLPSKKYPPLRPSQKAERLDLLQAIRSLQTRSSKRSSIPVA